MQKTAHRFPLFYVSGESECLAGKSNFNKAKDLFTQYGGIVLSGDSRKVTLKGHTLIFYGLDDPASRLVSPLSLQDLAALSSKNLLALAQESGKNVSEENVHFFRELSLLSQKSAQEKKSAENIKTILISHRSEFFPSYAQCNFDLVLSGHTNGGLWRIPFLLNGLYAKDQGFFPKYVGGLYQKNDVCMIASRGLSRKNSKLPRFYNRPELVIVVLEPV